jgi:hypothetical protein
VADGELGERPFHPLIIHVSAEPLSYVEVGSRESPTVDGLRRLVKTSLDPANSIIR